jgi:hypothetical protein
MLPATPPAMLVAVVAEVAVDALPVNAPTNDADVTDVRPASVVDVEPSAMLVEPMVTELFVKAALGIDVSPAPLPANPVDDKIPVLGTNVSFVLETFCGISPVLAVTQVGYTTDAVATSFVIVVVAATVDDGTVPVALIVTAHYLLHLHSYLIHC